MKVSLDSRAYTNVLLTAIALALGGMALSQSGISLLPKAQAQNTLFNREQAAPVNPSSGVYVSQQQDLAVAEATKEVASANREVASAIRELATQMKDIGSAVRSLQPAGSAGDTEVQVIP